MSNLIPIVAIIIACAVIMLLIIRKFIKDEIAENNDLIRRFRELAKEDPFISGILDKSGCDEKSLSIETPKSFSKTITYYKDIKSKKEKFIKLLNMPCIKAIMDVSEIVDRYLWCKKQGEKACSKCCKNKQQEFSLSNQGGYTDNFWNPYFGCHIGACYL